MASAMVLCAGFGTRLRPLTDNLPKPLVPVGDRPLVDHILELVLSERTLNVVVNAHHAPEKLLSHFKEKWPSVHVSSEGKILGTAGGVFAARRFFSEGDVVVINGDIDGELPLSTLLGEPPSAMLLAVVPGALGSGTVGFDDEGHVVRLRGERFGVETRSGDYMGVMRLGGELVAALPEEGCLIGDVALPRLRRGLRDVRAIAVATDFIDIGSLESYFAANLRWLRRTQRGSYVASEARVAAEVRLHDSLVMGASVVEGVGELREVIALPGSRVVAPLARALVLPDFRVIPIGS